MPEVFALGVPVFENGDRYRVEARLRYRIADGGKLTLWYDLLRPHKILEDAMRFQWKAIEAALGVTVLNGAVLHTTGPDSGAQLNSDGNTHAISGS